MVRARLALASLTLAALGLCGHAAAWSPPSAARRQYEAARTPPGFVYVPGGECWIGSDDEDADDDARPRRRVFVPSFYIAVHEVTRAEWKRFRPEHAVPDGHAEHPVTNVLRPEAEAYCRFVGGRLPTDLEWEKAARGADGRRYPWGDAFDAERCNLGRGPGGPTSGCLAPGARRGLRPVHDFPAGASPYGVLNMAGNAWEWVSDAYGGDPERGIIRGGAYGYGERAARTYHRAIEGAGVT
jgi:formylglycine-generating enzyme required for sulfatase activity